MTLVQIYVEALAIALAAAHEFPAVVERSPVRAVSRKEPQVLSLLPGAEQVDISPIGRTTRTREIQLVVHTAGDDHLEITESVFEAAHPIVMQFQANGIVEVYEHGTDEPRYVAGDLTRQATTKRYRIVYQTDEHSLSN